MALQSTLESRSAWPVFELLQCVGPGSTVESSEETVTCLIRMTFSVIHIQLDARNSRIDSKHLVVQRVGNIVGPCRCWLGCNVVWTSRYVVPFRWNIMPPSSVKWWLYARKKQFNTSRTIIRNLQTSVLCECFFPFFRYSVSGFGHLKPKGNCT